ncbi:small ribosomal subunit protein eS8-like [Macrotis lagotis]|uniref:small ribosomal subunit protein eS8-like n=1 Tax=Macrotis lagotis TaxID=92651 RepID=UPI003D688EB1
MADPLQLHSLQKSLNAWQFGFRTCFWHLISLRVVFIIFFRQFYRGFIGIQQRSQHNDPVDLPLVFDANVCCEGASRKFYCIQCCYLDVISAEFSCKKSCLSFRSIGSCAVCDCVHLFLYPCSRRPWGITRDSWHKRRKTGGKRKPYHKKRKYEPGRPPAKAKIGPRQGQERPRRIHTVRVRGGNKKYRALRLDVGNFSWGSECCPRKTRIIDVVYNVSSNELGRTKTLVQNCLVLIDSTSHRPWHEAHCALPLGRKKGAKRTPEKEILNKKGSEKIQKKYEERKQKAKSSSLLEEQFQQGKLLACIAWRPGQCGPAAGYVLEGRELEFYLRKTKARKGK